MAPIKSRKHPIQALRRPVRATAFASLVVPGTLLAQQTLPTVNVQGDADTDYKATTSANPKIARPLLDTPQTVVVIKKEVLQEQQATTLAEALRNTPGVTMQMGENGNTATGDSIFMRGMDSQGNIFVDGIRDLGTFSRDLYNIEQVEVVKGPSGADIGRGSPTGYINLVTKVPTLDNFASGALSVGTGVFVRATADVNQRIGGRDSTTAARLNVMKQGGGVAGRDEVTNDAWGIAPAISFGLGTPTRIHLYAQHFERDRRPDGGLPTVGLPGYYSQALGNVRPGKVDTDNFYGSKSDQDVLRLDMVTARFEHDLSPGLTVRNVTRYGVAHQDLRLTGLLAASFPNPANPASYTVALSRQGKIQRNEILANQTSVSADFRTGPLRHTLVAGVEILYEKQSNTALGVIGTQTPQNLYNPSTSLAFADIGETGAKTRGETTTVAGFIGDTVDVTDRIQLGASLRLDRYRSEFLGLPAVLAADQSTLNLKKSDLLKSWRFSGLYKLAPNGTAYAAYGYSEKPPGSDNFTLASATPNATTGIVNSNAPNLDPQKAKSLEIGTKWDVLDNRLALTAALFRTELRNDLARLDPVDGGVTQFGKRRIQGLELGAVGQVTQHWNVMAGLARMDTKVLQGNDTTMQQSGGMILWSPKLTFSAWTTYTFASTGLMIGGGARHVSSQQRQVNANVTATTNMPRLDSYTVFDAMASYNFTRNFGLQLNLYNLADKFYLASMNNSGSRYTLGTPRTVMLTGVFRF